MTLKSISTNFTHRKNTLADQLICGGNMQLYPRKPTLPDAHIISLDLLQDSDEFGGLKFWTVDELNRLFERTEFSVADKFSKGIVCFTKLIPA